MDMPLGRGKTLDVGTWTYGLLSDFIQGGANSIGAGFGAIAFDPNDFNFQSGKLYGLMGAVFLFNAVLKAASYLAGHPLPSVRVTETLKQSAEGATKYTRVTEPVASETQSKEN